MPQATFYHKFSAPRPYPSFIQMLLPPLYSLNDSQADILSFPPPPSLSLQSSQSSQISPSPVQSPQAGAPWHNPLLDAVIFPHQLGLGEISPYFLDGGSCVSLDHRSGWPLVDPHSYQVPQNDYHAPFFLSDYPAITEINGSTSSLSASPAVLAPVSARITWSTLM